MKTAPREAGVSGARPPATTWAWAGLLLAALLVRLVVVAAVPNEILARDGQQYEQVARGLLEHGSYGLQTKRPPGYPTLIAGVYALLGVDLLRLRIVEAALGTLSVALIGAVGASLFGGLAGLLAAALAAFHPVLAVMPATQYSENTLVLVMVLAFASAFAAWRRGGLWRWALAGGCFGLSLLVRPNLVTLLPGVALGFGLALRRERRGWLSPLLVTAAAAVLVLVPWTLRNHRVHHRWFFVASGGGSMFYAGNSEQATGAPNVAPPIDSLTLAEIGRQPDTMSQERVLYARGMRFIREHPARAARLYLIKLGNLFALYPTTQTRTPYSTPLAKACQTLASLAIFVGALLALRHLPRAPALWPLVGGIVTFALANSFFWTVMRYRLAFEPCLLWMAALGWSTLLERREVNP